VVAARGAVTALDSRDVAMWALAGWVAFVLLRLGSHAGPTGRALLAFVGALLALLVALQMLTRDADGDDDGTSERTREPPADVDERDTPGPGVDEERDGPDAGADAPGADVDALDPEAERLLAHLAEFAESGIRPPTRSRMARFGEYSPSAYVERFGSWEAALAAAGVDGDGGSDAD
jgi:hypothetical protein